MTAILPAIAAKKLRDLEQRHADASALVRAATGAVANLRVSLGNARNKRSTNPTDTSFAEMVRDIEQQIDVAEREVAMRSQRETNAGQVVAKINDWLRKLPHARELVDARSPEFGDASLELVRGEIASLLKEQQGIARSPMSSADAKAAIKQTVEQWARSGAPRINTVGNVSVDFLDGGTRAPWMILAWIDPAKMIAALERSMPSGNGVGLSANDRRERERQIESELLLLERQEEAMISIAIDGGQDIPRRPACDPRAVLNVEIKKAAKVAA